MPPNSAMSSRSSFHSETSSASLLISARANASAISCGIKQRIKNPAKGGNGPIKRAKHALSVVSSPVVSDTEDTAGDQASIKTVESPAGIEVMSDGEAPVDLEEELGMSSPYAFLTVSLINFSASAQKTWRSPIYSFFKPKVTIQVHNGCVAHFFTCSAKKCKSGTRGVQRYQDKGDKSSTANLRHHAIRCFGEDAVNMAVKGEASVSHSGNIFTAFANQGQWAKTYSHHAHSSSEFR